MINEIPYLVDISSSCHPSHLIKSNSGASLLAEYCLHLSGTLRFDSIAVIPNYVTRIINILQLFLNTLDMERREFTPQIRMWAAYYAY
jgi:hypothetical protein